jgi:hypothetical protein
MFLPPVSVSFIINSQQQHRSAELRTFLLPARLPACLERILICFSFTLVHFTFYAAAAEW